MRVRRRTWQFLLPIHHDVSSDRAWWLPYRKPCVSCQSPASAGLGSPGDSRSHSGHVGNTRRRRLITCCRLWPAARRFWLGLHLITANKQTTLLYHLRNHNCDSLLRHIFLIEGISLVQIFVSFFSIIQPFRHSALINCIAVTLRVNTIVTSQRLWRNN